MDNGRRNKMMEILKAKSTNGDTMGPGLSTRLRFKDVLPTSSSDPDPYAVDVFDQPDEMNAVQPFSAFRRHGDKENIAKIRRAGQESLDNHNQGMAQLKTVINAGEATTRTRSNTTSTSYRGETSSARALRLKHAGLGVKRKLFFQSDRLKRLNAVRPKPRQQRTSLLKAKRVIRSFGQIGARITRPSMKDAISNKGGGKSLHPCINDGSISTTASTSDNIIASVLAEDVGYMPSPPTVAAKVSPQAIDIETEERPLTTLHSTADVSISSDIGLVITSSLAVRASVSTRDNDLGREETNLAESGVQRLAPSTPTRAAVTPERRQHEDSMRLISTAEATTPVTPRSMTSEDNLASPLRLTPLYRQIDERMQEDDLQEADPMTPPKRRRANPPEWIKNKAKEANNAGKDYINTRGQAVSARKIGPGCGLTCRKKCRSAVTEEQRQRIFNNFWMLGNPSLRWQYIAGRATTSSVKRRTVAVLEGEGPRRNNTNTYSFLIDKKNVPVCQKMFVDTLGISRQIVATALTKAVASEGAVLQDGRGKKRGIKSALRERKLEDVKKHIKKFRRVPGHFTRKDSNVFYLDSGLNARKMHTIYRMEREAEGSTTNLASLAFYRMALRQYRLKFLRPKKDQCAECLSFSNKTPAEKTANMAKHKEHLRRALVSRAMKKLDSTKSRRNKKICVATFDMQSVLQCPKGENAEFYYRRRANCLNFTIYDAGKGQGYCYFWDETTGKRGSNEIASFLCDFIRVRKAEGVEEFRFYSDNCFGQNKNATLYALYYFLAQELKVKIAHTYLEKGHTQMECDSMHAAIERRSKRMTVYTPSQWCAVIRMAKVTLPRYEVKEVTKNDIFNVKALTSLVNLKKVPTSNVREIVFEFGKTTASFRKQFGGDLSAEKITKKNTPDSMPALQFAYTGRLPLKPMKQRDLNWLLDNGHIAESSMPFYVDLKAWAETLATTSTSTPGDEDSDSEYSDEED